MVVRIISQDNPMLSDIISRRELSIDVAEHRSIFKSDRNTYYPRFIFTLIFRSKTRTPFKQVFRIYSEPLK